MSTATSPSSWTAIKGFKLPQVPLDVEGYTAAPEGLQLEQVHVYVRHGERTPVGVRLSSSPANIPSHWILCHTAHRFQSAVSSFLGPSGAELSPQIQDRERQHRLKFDEVLHTRKLVERQDGTVVEGECLLGELTDLGRQTTYHFGQNLRRLYVERLGFMPDTLSHKNTVYFRSTNMPRTMESLQQVIHGLYPNHKCQPEALAPLLIRNGKDENLIGNTYACKRLEMLQIGFAKAAAEAYNKTLEPLDKKLSKYIDGNPIRVDGKPRASGIMDTIRASKAHGIKIPPEFEDKKIIDSIEQAVVSEWFGGYKTEEVRRLGMGRLLSSLTTKMERKASKGASEPLKLLVHSTHDTAIAALCQTLDVFDDKWPAFTASLSFELFKQVGSVVAKPETKSSAEQASRGFPQNILAHLSGNSTNSGHYIRLRYQNKSLPLPLCAAEGDHLPGYPEFCTFAAFQRRVKELTPKDFNQECLPEGRS
ncbi:phosphoglycerate mutase-like protein [Crepidotus variabilis]|uniref:Phosphoglycerate mutase-like protein n=1 Tax=Crepidotus variabilis TaxID=179855 RepID=A0A9P6E693_9AGAR|nr:phosphoglycerate mutase-like protein [Crepidotus variabilis]